MAKKIEFDVAWDEWTETFESAMAEAVAEVGCTWRLITAHGPGGGWPVVEFTVADENLPKLIEYMGCGDDLEFWLDQAEQA